MWGDASVAALQASAAHVSGPPFLRPLQSQGPPIRESEARVQRITVTRRAANIIAVHCFLLSVSGLPL